MPLNKVLVNSYIYKVLTHIYVYIYIVFNIYEPFSTKIPMSSV